MTDGDKIFMFLQKCNRNHNVPDIHSFKARINDGVVWVECRGYEIYIETQIFDENTDAIISCNMGNCRKVMKIFGVFNLSL